MNAVKIIIPGSLPGMNEYTFAQRVHWSAGFRMKKDAQQIPYFCILQQHRGVSFPGKVEIEFIFYEKDHRRDEDNVTSFGKKVILDALQQAGTIQNDNRKTVISQVCSVDVDKATPRIEVIIREASR